MGGVHEACRAAAMEQGPLFRRSWGRYPRCRGLHTVQAESVVLEGRQSNGDRYSVASVSTDSATGKPRYATAPASKVVPRRGPRQPVSAKHRQHGKSASYADTVNMTRAYGTAAKDSTCCAHYDGISYGVVFDVCL